MTDDTEAIRARLNAATPGPWDIYRYRHGGGRISIDDTLQLGRKRNLIADTLPEDEGIVTVYNEGDREFFLNAPADIAYLLAENARLSALIDTVPNLAEWEWGWAADESIRQVMRPKGPRIQMDDSFGTPEEIARFPKGQRIRRRKAGPWEPASIAPDPTETAQEQGIRFARNLGMTNVTVNGVKIPDDPKENPDA